MALGLQRGSERVVLLSVLPIALGHAAAVAAVLFGVLTLGLFIDRVVLIRLMESLSLAGHDGSLSTDIAIPFASACKPGFSVSCSGRS